ncbi:MAG: nucleoside deaminase [Ignavibacteria bacterium]|nr:nucleoside deaminase [Ignavibacteria bacterium]
MDKFFKEAIKEAKQGLEEGGIPIGSVIVIDGKIAGRGHNRRIQKGSTVLHGEMDALENAGRLKQNDYKRATLYTTLSPCHMCCGAILLYKIPKVIIGENRTFKGAEELLIKNGVELVVLNDNECIEIMKEFVNKNPELWDEDIGE